MSRLAKKPMTIPTGTDVTVAPDGMVTVKGPQGELSRKVTPEVKVAVDDGTVVVEKNKNTRLAQSLIGTFASHIGNMIVGVNEPYVKKLIVEGVGYRAETQGNKLVMQLGFSHPVELDIPEGLTVTVEKEMITVTGIDKDMVGHFAALIRSKRKPEPYKGKGIRYEDEIIRRKQGKKAV